MNTHLQRRFVSLVTTAALTMFVFLIVTVAQTTKFAYQGNLNDGSAAASGTYDLQFALYDSVTGGAQVGATQTQTGVQVTNGSFAVQLDFGAVSFPGTDRFLEIRVKHPADSTYTTLSPRQPITSAPYAIRSLSAASADNLGGQAAANYLQTNTTDFVRNQTAQQASSNFNVSGTGTAGIFNATTQFNLNGDHILSNPGTENTFVGFNAGSSNSASGNSFFGTGSGYRSTGGVANSFFGSYTGYNNNTGSNNSLFGREAGLTNTAGSNNSFFGYRAGYYNTTGSNNTAIGNVADVGPGNLSYATALGANANVSTSDTIVLGKAAGTYDGVQRSADTVQIPGTLRVNALGALTAPNTVTFQSPTIMNGALTVNNAATVQSLNVGGSVSASGSVNANSATINGPATVGSLTVNSNATVASLTVGTGVNISNTGNITAGTATINGGATIGTLTVNSNATVSSLTVGGNAMLSGNVSANGSITAGSATIFNGATVGNLTVNNNAAVTGTSAANIFNAATQFNLNGSRILSNPGTDNLFAGVGAGQNSAGSSYNSFFGRSAGLNTTGEGNSFFGWSAGNANTAGVYNSVFGVSAGLSLTGNYNSIFGSQAGYNTTGNRNAFFGNAAGIANTTGNNNTIIGDSANVGANNLNYATALGANAVVSNSDTIVIGKVAGTYNTVARPADTVVIPGNLNLSGNLTGSFTVPAANVTGTLSTSQIPNLDASKITTGTLGTAQIPSLDASKVTTGIFNAARIPDLSASYIQNQTTQQSSSNFNVSGTGTANIFNAATQFNLGGARILSAGNANTFVGINAGAINTGSSNSFFGLAAGASNTTGNNNSIFGRDAGFSNTTGNNNLFFGYRTGGFNTTGGNNSFFGYQSGLTNTTGTNNTLVGDSTDVSANNLSYATALGANAIVSANDTIVLGKVAGTYNSVSRPADNVIVNGLLQVSTLGAAGSTTLCRNASNQISTCSSSLRYKTNVAPFVSGLSFVNQLRPVSFDWKDGGTRDVGFVAEEIAKINPLFAIYNQKGEVEGIKYDRLSVAFANAFKEQQQQIETQQQQITEQRKQIEELKLIVCQIKPDASVCK